MIVSIVFTALKTFSRPIFASMTNEVQFLFWQNQVVLSNAQKWAHFSVDAKTMLFFSLNKKQNKPVALSQNVLRLKKRDPVMPKAWRPHPYVSMTTTWRKKKLFIDIIIRHEVCQGLLFPFKQPPSKERLQCVLISMGIRRPSIWIRWMQMWIRIAPPSVAACDLKAAGWNPAALLCLLIHLPIITRPQEALGKWGN